MGLTSRSSQSSRNAHTQPGRAVPPPTRFRRAGGLHQWMDDVRFRRPILVALVIAFVGCEQSTGPALDAVDDASLAQLAEHVSEANDVRLPSLGALLRASREAIQAMDEGNTAAVRHFHAARGFAMAAEDSLEAGNDDAAKRLSNRSYGHALQGILAALGPDVAARGSGGLGRRTGARPGTYPGP